MVPKQFRASVICLLAAIGCSSKPPPRDFIKENIQRWRSELAEAGGSWEAWQEKISGFQNEVRKLLESKPQEIAGLVGLDGFLFFRRSLEVLIAGDLRAQKDGRDPYPAIVDFHRQLKDRGVELLFCPIPVKAAVFPEKVWAGAAPSPAVNLWTKKLMLELAEAGVECVDLLPHFLAERDKAQESFYMPLDTHWSNRALRVAAHVFAKRIKAYPWFAEVAKSPIRYQTKTVTTKRRGDIVRMLPEPERVKYPPMDLEAEQVLNPDGSFYKDEESSPIVLLGDSYAGVFHLEDCQNAGLTAHLAKELGIPIDLILGQGMGPQVRAKLARRGPGALKGKRLVIWTLSERDLFNYRSPWEIIQIP